jgi:hypothetical protein
MTDCHDSERGEPITALGYTPEALSIPAITRHHCAGFAMPERQSRTAAITTPLRDAGDERGRRGHACGLSSLAGRGLAALRGALWPSHMDLDTWLIDHDPFP